MRNNHDERRDSRVTILLVVIAIIWGIWKVLQKLSGRAMGLVVTSGSVYYFYLIVTCIILALCVAVLLVDMILFLVFDLFRYNVIDNDYKKYDQKSDSEFALLLRDGKIVLVIAFFCISLIIPISYLYNDRSMLLALIILAMLVILIIIATFQFRKIIFVRIHGNSRKYACYRYGIAIIIALTLIMVSGNGNKKSEISVDYGNDGCICVMNTSDYNFGNVDILFYSETGEYIDGISVSKTEVLRAKETVVTTYEGEENVVWAQAEDSYYEVLHWKYTYDIDKLKLENGKYYVLISNKQKNRCVKIYNMFTVMNGYYEYASDNIEKEY